MTAYLDQLALLLAPYQQLATAAFIALLVIDGWTTYQVISRGMGREGNFALAAIMRQLGTKRALLLTRVVAIAAVIYEPLIAWPLIPVWGYVVYNNYRNMRA